MYRRNPPPPGAPVLTYHPIAPPRSEWTPRDLIRYGNLETTMANTPTSIAQLVRVGGRVQGVNVLLGGGFPQLGEVFQRAMPMGPAALLLVDMYHLTAENLLAWLNDATQYLTAEKDYLLPGDQPSSFTIFWMGHLFPGEFGVINNDVVWYKRNGSIVVPVQDGLPEAYHHPNPSWVQDPRLSVAVIKRLPSAAANGMYLLQVEKRLQNDVGFTLPNPFCVRASFSAGYEVTLSCVHPLLRAAGARLDKVLGHVQPTQLVLPDIAAQVGAIYLQRSPNAGLLTSIQQSVADRVTQTPGGRVLQRYIPDLLREAQAGTGLYVLAGQPALHCTAQMVTIPRATWSSFVVLKQLRAAVGDKIPSLAVNPWAGMGTLLKIIAIAAATAFILWKSRGQVWLLARVVRMFVGMVRRFNLSWSVGDAVSTQHWIDMSIVMWRRMFLLSVFVAPVVEEAAKHVPVFGWFFRRIIFACEFEQDMNLMRTIIPSFFPGGAAPPDNFRGAGVLTLMSICWRSMHLFSTGSFARDVLTHFAVNLTVQTVSFSGIAYLFWKSGITGNALLEKLSEYIPRFTDLPFALAHYGRVAHMIGCRLQGMDLNSAAVKVQESWPHSTSVSFFSLPLGRIALFAALLYGLYCLWTPQRAPVVVLRNQSPLMGGPDPIVSPAQHVNMAPEVSTNLAAGPISPLAGLTPAEVLAIAMTNNGVRPAAIPETTIAIPDDNPPPTQVGVSLVEVPDAPPAEDDTTEFILPRDITAPGRDRRLMEGRFFSENQVGPWADRVADWSTKCASGFYLIKPYRYKETIAHTEIPPMRPATEMELKTDGTPISVFDALGQHRTRTHATLTLCLAPGVWFCRPASSVSNMIYMARCRLLAAIPGIPKLMIRHLNYAEEEILYHCDGRSCGLAQLYDPSARNLMRFDPIVVTEEMEDEWLAKFSGMKYRRNEIALADVRARGFRLTDKGCKVITLFAKTDETLFRTEASHPALRPRAIAQLDPRCQAYLGPAVHEVAERLARLWDYDGLSINTLVPRPGGFRPLGGRIPDEAHTIGLNYQICYAYRPTATKLTEWMERVTTDVLAFQNSAHSSGHYFLRIMVAGDDSVALLADARHIWWFESDVSMCDQSQIFETIGRDCSRYRLIGLSNDHATAIQALCRGPMKLDCGKTKVAAKYTLLPHAGIKVTGGADTSCGTTIAVGESLAVSFVNLLRNGQTPSGTELAAEMLRYGFKLKVKTFSELHPPITFLKGWWVPVYEGTLVHIWTPLPGRLLKVGIADGDLLRKYRDLLPPDANLFQAMNFHLFSVAKGLAATFTAPPLSAFVTRYAALHFDTVATTLDAHQVAFDRPSTGMLSHDFGRFLFLRYALDWDAIIELSDLYSTAVPPSVVVHKALALIAAQDYN